MIIDGQNTTMGRLASYAAKEALRGENIVVLNCDRVLISGNKKNIEEEFKQTRGRVGSGQRGPKISRMSDRIVKKAIRGMLPNYREGRGRDAFKRVRCYVGIPKEFADQKAISINKSKPIKYVHVEHLSKIK